MQYLPSLNLKRDKSYSLDEKEDVLSIEQIKNRLRMSEFIGSEYKEREVSIVEQQTFEEENLDLLTKKLRAALYEKTNWVEESEDEGSSFLSLSENSCFSINFLDIARDKVNKLKKYNKKKVNFQKFTEVFQNYGIL